MGGRCLTPYCDGQKTDQQPAATEHGGELLIEETDVCPEETTQNNRPAEAEVWSSAGSSEIIRESSITCGIERNKLHDVEEQDIACETASGKAREEPEAVGQWRRQRHSRDNRGCESQLEEESGDRQADSSMDWCHVTEGVGVDSVFDGVWDSQANWRSNLSHHDAGVRRAYTMSDPTRRFVTTTMGLTTMPGAVDTDVRCRQHLLRRGPRIPGSSVMATLVLMWTLLVRLVGIGKTTVTAVCEWRFRGANAVRSRPQRHSLDSSRCESQLKEESGDRRADSSMDWCHVTERVGVDSVFDGVWDSQANWRSNLLRHDAGLMRPPSIIL